MEKNGDVYHVRIPYKEIPLLTYNETTEPLVVCLRDIYAHMFNAPELHLEHVDLEEFISNSLDVPKDSIMTKSKEDLEKLVIRLFEPIPVEKPGMKEKSELIEGILDIKMTQSITEDLAVVEVLDRPEKFFYMSKKNYSVWKLYDSK